MDAADLALLLDGLDAHADGLLVFDRQGRVRFANRPGLAIGDMTLDVALGRRLPELAEAVPYFRENLPVYTLLATVIEEVMASGTGITDDDASRPSVTGDLVPVSFRLHPIERDGEVVGAVLVTRDHAMESSLMFRQASVGMAHIDREGHVREANDALLTLLGTTQEASRTHPFLDLVHEPDRSAVRPILEGVLRRDVLTARVQARFDHADGTVRWGDLGVASNGLGGPTTGGACAVVQDITERVQLQAELAEAEQRLRRLALHDPLTGLPNRTQLADQLTGAQARARADGGHVAVLFIDLDGFKLVNDTAGHDAGDRLLVLAGERLNGVLRQGDMASRLGGDEFVLCCADLDADPDTARAEAARIAERARAALEAPFVLDHRAWTLGASVGIALSHAGADEPDALIRAADADMYRAKSNR